MENLKKLVQLVFVVLGCLHLAGGPYSLLQAYAWAGMLVSYSKTDGFFKGARDTFSGEKPCALCCKIAAARKSEPAQKEEPVPVASLGKLLDCLVTLDLPVLSPPRGADYRLPGLPEVLASFRRLAIVPALPPP